MSKSIQVYKTAAIKVTYDPDVCVHSADCVRGLPAVFDPGRRRWVRLDNASAEEVAAVIRRCPSGALQFTMKSAEVEPGEEGVPDATDAANSPGAAGEHGDRAGKNAAPVLVSITISEGGPLSVRGNILLTTADGRVIATGDRALLCRCGQTKKSPFCDGSHAGQPPPAPVRPGS